MDDFLQNDLHYELVTLSACETGRAAVLGADELIGLGRGFLLAGAQALLLSMWRVEDKRTTTFIEHFYALLKSGETKSSALRTVQTELLRENPDLHPFFWGAFQIIGNVDPLSNQG
jgi:CHAT domain-containing protein